MLFCIVEAGLLEAAARKECARTMPQMSLVCTHNSAPIVDTSDETDPVLHHARSSNRVKALLEYRADHPDEDLIASFTDSSI